MPFSARFPVVMTVACLSALCALLWFGVPGRGAAQAGAGDLPAGVLALLSPPEGVEARSTALIVTGPDGWTPELQARGLRLAQMHTVVIGLDGPARIALAGGCDAAAAGLAPLAQDLGARVGAARRAPVLVGIGDGTGLALRAALDDPDRFKGLVTEGLATAGDGCGVRARALSPDDGKSPLRWHEVATESLAAGLAGVRFYDPVEKGADEAFTQAYLALAGTDHAFDTATGAGGDLSDLPITVHHDRAIPTGDTYAIFLSGDGGWARFDEEVSDALAARGVPVVGMSSMRYLWKEKTPDRIATDIARIDAVYREGFGARRVLLVGFSLGANVTPFYAPLLPEEMRADVAALVLLSPERRTGFEIVMGGWMGKATGAQDVAGAIIDASGIGASGVEILCLSGREDEASVCPMVAGHARVLPFEGGHHMGNDYGAIVEAIMSQL